MKRSLTGILLLSLIAVWLDSRANDDKKPTLSAAEIISQHLDAVGGKQKLLQLKSRVAIGTIRKENEPEAKMAIMSEAPNHVAAAYIFLNYDWRLAYDGRKTAFRPQLPRIYAAIESKSGDVGFRSDVQQHLALQPASAACGGCNL
ncbi:MAG: hypothetical protein ACR2G5_16285 [Pyrinomonadaceae bacterium]